MELIESVAFSSLSMDSSKLPDPCIYFGEGVIIFVYMDDIIIAGENDEIIERISDGLKSMIEDLLRRTNVLNCRPVSTPMDPNQSFA
jgi:hypothetical protein